MYGMPYSIVYNEETGRLEPPHAALMRRIRRAHRLRSRYRSLVIRRLIVRAFRAPWRAVASLYAAVSGTQAATPSAAASRAE